HVSGDGLQSCRWEEQSHGPNHSNQGLRSKICDMGAAPEPLKPIFTAHLFGKLEDKLLELLRSLSPEDWEKQTVAPKWKVKDVAAHLLDTQLRKLSICRDGYIAERPNLS